MTDAADVEPAAAPEVHVSDGVLAAMAARSAVGVAGVARLQPPPARALATAVGNRVGGRRAPGETLTTDGVDVTATGPGSADVEIDLAVVWGRPCLEIATTVQEQVVERLRALAGVEVTVTVNIVDVEWPDGANQDNQ